MDPRFDEIADKPENNIFRVVFFPDRVYHAQYLNATRSPRYRYNVREVRGKQDIIVLKGEVFLDGQLFTNFVRSTAPAAWWRPPGRTAAWAAAG
jgi:hypothetical protein